MHNAHRVIFPIRTSHIVYVYFKECSWNSRIHIVLPQLLLKYRKIGCNRCTKDLYNIYCRNAENSRSSTKDYSAVRIRDRYQWLTLETEKLSQQQS